LQNYFRLYDKLSGMTGTAMTEASEFYQIYKLGVIPIPTNKVMQRVDQSDLVYKTEHAKFLAVVDDIVERHRKGQPVLVGTVSVEKSEELSSFLVRKGVAHEVLNAKQHEREAAIVARAGCKSAVTVATNMAGRGTDIMLGGNPEFFADFALQQRGFSPVETPEDYEREWPAELARQRQLVAAEHDEVVALGGLYVLGTERHESRRIDNQLRGRSGRQGDPGESRFYLSLQDELMRRFNSALVERFLGAAGIPEDVPIESNMVSNAIKSAQTQVESQNFEIRKNVLKYDDVLNRQRQVIYVERRSVLEGADLRDQMIGFIDDAVRGQVDFATANTFPEEWNLDVLWQQLGALYPVTLNYEKLIEEAGDISGLSSEYLSELVSNDALSQYELREQTLTPEITRELERRVVLSVLDRRWRDHLYEMDYLQEGIGLRAMAQRDPLVEYQKEGYELFTAMMEGIKEESVGFLFHAEVNVERTSQGELASASLPELGGGEQELHYSAPGESGAPEQQSVRAADETSRNAPCPCGSGKKYKRCHGDPRNR
jgi:preprotein translocase subunit SecA